MGIQLFERRKQTKAIAACHELFVDTYTQLQRLIDVAKNEDSPRYVSVADGLSEQDREQLEAVWKPIVRELFQAKQSIIEDSLYTDVLQGAHDPKRRLDMQLVSQYDLNIAQKDVASCQRWIQKWEHIHDHLTPGWKEALSNSEQRVAEAKRYIKAHHMYETLLSDTDDILTYLNDMIDTMRRTHSHLTLLLEDGYVLLNQLDPEYEDIAEDRSIEIVDERARDIEATLAKMRGV